jgi:uroporphyrin-III C-methyltransferase / precorrin-2 dehydrogenase / sirohydrochlorin ferrochelatase
MTPAVGLVSLVGAGPGHPDFLTLKALRRLREADLVLHDALVSAEVLALAEHADRIDVGKRGGRAATSQDAIEHTMIAAARGGLRVVRLKGGDPFVFGRGGEEALALQRAGIPFEVVPGVTTAVSAPALAGIPVTHRGTASGFLVVTATDPEEMSRVLDNVVPASITIVVMMGVRLRAEVVALLLESGWSADTPAAIVLGAATPGAWTWKGPLASMATARIEGYAAELAGTLVIGAVAGLPLDLVDGSSMTSERTTKGPQHVGA